MIIDTLLLKKFNIYFQYLRTVGGGTSLPQNNKKFLKNAKILIKNLKFSLKIAKF